MDLNCDNAKKTRKSYPNHRKLEAVSYAEKYGNAAAAKEFGTDESNIRRWKKQKPVIKAMNPKKRCRRSRKEFWPELESQLKTWIISRRNENRRVSTTGIRLKAKELAKHLKINDFKGSKCWCFLFMKRHNLSVRAVTSIGQKLPKDWEEKMAVFGVFVKNAINGVNFEHIGNMDEVSISFDMPSGFTVETKGSTDVRITTTGNEKCNFTVVLCATADGGKCKPLVIFKRKTIPKGVFPKGVVVTANEKGWVDANMVSYWLENIWRKRKNSFFCQKSVLIYDSARPHITEEVKEKVKKYSQLAVIPGGLTSKLQPLDLSVNKSFKIKMREKWEDWMVNGYHSFTKSGSIKRASYAEVCQWIDECWSEVTADCIKNGFKAANICEYPTEALTTVISRATDSEEESEEESEDQIESEIPESFNELFDLFNTESDEEFDGFN
jgi:hypothetical protein